MGQEFSTFSADCRAPAVAVEAETDDIGAASARPKSRLSKEEMTEAVSTGPNETYIVFDWDDTLLCSSAVNMQTCTEEQLLELEGAVLSILHTSMSIAETLIVTNGNATWVKDSATRFLPGVLPTLEKLRVISARALNEAAYPGDPYMWKRVTFADIFRKEKSVPAGKTGLNLVALGDQLPEIEAARHACDLAGGTSLVKTLKFRESPNARELIGQIKKAEELLLRLAYKNTSGHFALARNVLTAGNFPSSMASGWRLEKREEDTWGMSLSLGLKDFWPLFS